MPSLDANFAGIRDALASRYGWGESTSRDRPGQDAFEGLAAVLLDYGLDSRKSAAALSALREEGLLDPQALAESDLVEIMDALASAGVNVSRAAVSPLQRLARWLVERHHGTADDLLGPDGEVSTSQLRDELQALNGIGPATADALLLHGLHRPVYPLDRPTYRILARHGWIDLDFGYDEARDTLERLAPDDPALLANLAASFERLGRDYCRASAPKCDDCPLRPFLPDGGPVEADG